jgi:hypothetical protein
MCEWLNWRSQLCAEPACEWPVPQTSPDTDECHWATQEFGRAEFADGRLHNRLLGMAQDFYARPLVPVNQACERLSWYVIRWNIEVDHWVVKSGCRIEDRRLGNADILQACLAINRVVA